MPIYIIHENHILKCDKCKKEVLGGFNNVEAEKVIEELGWSSISFQESLKGKETKKLFCPECSANLRKSLGV